MLQKQNKPQGTALRYIGNGMDVVHPEGKNNATECTDYAVFRFYVFKKIFKHELKYPFYDGCIIYLFTENFNFLQKFNIKKRKLLAFKHIIV